MFIGGSMEYLIVGQGPLLAVHSDQHLQEFTNCIQLKFMCVEREGQQETTSSDAILYYSWSAA